MKHQAWLKRVIEEQKDWIDACGGNLAGYIALYFDLYGRSMEEVFQIYMADTEALNSLEKRLCITEKCIIYAYYNPEIDGQSEECIKA